MGEPSLNNAIRRHRELVGLSQQSLGELAGVSRQAIIAIEGGRQVPSTSLSLRLARALRCGVEDLFSLNSGSGIAARLAPRDPASVGGARVALAQIDGRWAAHLLPPDASAAADGLVTATVSARTGLVRPLTDPAQLRRNVLVSGCAPILGALAQRVGGRFADARATWLPASSHRSLDLLEQGLVHIAGLHLPGGPLGEDNVAAVRRRFPDQRMLVVNLTRWRQGFVLPAGNPLAIRSGADLLRQGLKLARREEGAGAHALVQRLLTEQGAEHARLLGPLAAGHAEVAQLVRLGAADVGVAIESVALAAGLDFVPLAAERFDLVVPARLAEAAPVSRLLDMIDDPAFRTEMDELPGYDGELAGHATTLEAA
ncbi:MAG: helix-turn-helix domain-containing protein [Gemmatimonadota bacterium]|nr:helix-turn-helix domain-containing protein [Gemmatimonadota bacterium]MDH3421671.1 helix-turn-helix domain-containing protein [Gemmatimonadota bacterium]